jgi:DNA-binding LytR/AlgR family response regulator
MLCEQLPQLEVVKAFNNPETFLNEIPGLKFDLCIMDIEMPAINGLEIANLLYGKLVIFVTAYKDYAADAYDLNAIDYVRKPIKRERLEQAVQKAVNRIKEKTPVRNFIQLNSDKGKTIVFFDQIVMIKTSDQDSRDKVVYLQDGPKILIKNMSFDKLMRLLPENDFCRINKKEVVAIRSIQVFSFDEITTNIQNENGKMITLNLSEVYRKDFLQKVSF